MAQLALKGEWDPRKLVPVHPQGRDIHSPPDSQVNHTHTAILFLGSFWEQWCIVSQTCPTDWHQSNPLKTLMSSYFQLQNLDEWQGKVQGFLLIIEDSSSPELTPSPPHLSPSCFIFNVMPVIGHMLNDSLCVESFTCLVSNLWPSKVSVLEEAAQRNLETGQRSLSWKVEELLFYPHLPGSQIRGNCTSPLAPHLSYLNHLWRVFPLSSLGHAAPPALAGNTCIPLFCICQRPNSSSASL